MAVKTNTNFKVPRVKKKRKGQHSKKDSKNPTSKNYRKPTVGQG